MGFVLDVATGARMCAAATTQKLRLRKGAQSFLTLVADSLQLAVYIAWTLGGLPAL